MGILISSNSKTTLMKPKIALVYLFFVVFLSSCVNTRITSSWKEPDTKVNISKLNKVLVVALFKNETTRHKAEDYMVSYLNGKGVVSYDYLNEKFNRENEVAIHTKIKADGFDGAITMRLIDINNEKSYTPGTNYVYPSYYRTFGGYYYQYWNNYNTPGSYITTKVYTVETHIYSIKEDKMIWTGLTETTNPDGFDNMTKEITEVVYKQMIKEGFITKK